MANGITARLFGRPRTYKPIGLDDGADLSRSTGASSTGSQVAEPRSPYAAPKMPSRGDYVPQADIEKYYSMLGSAPQRKDPGKASQVLSVLSDIFLNKDIPGTLREGGYQREQERYKSQLDPLKAKLAAGEQAYETEADRVSKQGALDLGAYNANKPTEPHYYAGLDKGGKPAEMSSRPGEEPTVLGPRYEPPPARPPATPAPHWSEVTRPGGEHVSYEYPAAGGEPIIHAEGQARVPDTPDKAGADYTKRQRQLSDQLSGEFRTLEAKRQSELDHLHTEETKGSLTGPTLSPEEHQAAVDRIEEEHADAKQRVHEHYASLAAGEGIDLGTPPDYRGQLNASKQTAKPATAPGPQQAAQPAGQGNPVKWNGKEWVSAKWNGKEWVDGATGKPFQSAAR